MQELKNNEVDLVSGGWWSSGDIQTITGYTSGGLGFGLTTGSLFGPPGMLVGGLIGFGAGTIIGTYYVVDSWSH